MHLLLWRHAEAADGDPDLTRRLTAKGHRQAEATAAWLRAHMPRGTRVLASPATRTIETVRALTETYEVVPTIAPGAQPEAVLAAAGWPDEYPSVLVVGHQPTLGAVAALLLAGEPMPWSVKKSGLWWLSYRLRGEDRQVVLRAVINSDLLG